MNHNQDENVALYKINHMNDLLSFANKCARNVGEEVVEEPSNIIFEDKMINPSLPKLSKKPGTPLSDRQLSPLL